MPGEYNWDTLIEEDDNVKGVQELACSSGNCEIQWNKEPFLNE